MSTDREEELAAERLCAIEAMEEELRAATERIVDVLHRHTPEKRDLPRTLSDVARLSASVLPVSRASLWLFDPERTCLRCQLTVQAGPPDEHLPQAIGADGCGAFFAALSKRPSLLFDAAVDDLRLGGFRPYFEHNQTTSALVIAVSVPGDVLGVLCHEQREDNRPFERAELNFASHVGHLLALALEADRRYTAQRNAAGTEAKYRHLVESLPTAIYSFDAFSDKLEYVSPQVSELCPFDPTSLLQQGVSAWIAMVHEDDRPQVEARFVPGGVQTGPDELVYRLCLPDGSVRHIRDRCRVVRDHLGRPLSIQGVLADISGQRQAELLTQELQRRYHTLLENVDLVALILDRDGRIEFVNQCFEVSTGYSRDDVIGLDAFDLMVPSEMLEQTRSRFLRDVRAQTIVPRFEHEIRTRAGDARRVVWTNTLLRSVGGEALGTCSLGLDVTERSRLESELMQQTKLESLGRLSAGVAHDFNNLLTVMMVQTDVLAADMGPERHEKARSTLTSAIRQAAELTHSLLVYARKEPIHPAPVKMDQLVHETLPLAATLAGKEVDISLELGAAEVKVVIDPVQVRQLLLNLAGNAIDATKGVGKRVRIETRVETVPEVVARQHGVSQGGEFMLLVVSDDGHGMDEYELRRAFEPFFTTKALGHGTGLGLSMCHSIVSRAGGFLTMESAAGEGTVCKVHLPVHGSELRPAQPPPGRRRTRPGAYALAPARVLVAERDERMRALIQKTLEDLSLDVTAVATADVAARIMATAPVDLLITGEHLPDASGVVLARSARASRPDMRVALLTEADAEHGEFDATLAGPLTSAAVRDMMIALLPRLGAG